MPFEMEWVPSPVEDENTISTLYWIIVYPNGDPGALAVAELCDGTSYEESDYVIASRKRFRNEQMANTYCWELANKHRLVCRFKTSSAMAGVLD